MTKLRRNHWKHRRLKTPTRELCCGRNLVVPVPILGNSISAARRTPLIIPFAGVYWFFKAPDLRLPKKPHEADGTPEVFNIHATDRHALSMEAHQNLGTLVDLSCCSEIQIAIRNADRYPGTVSLELIVINTTLGGRPSQSLGRSTVRSTQAWKLYDDRPPTKEILHFTVPANSRITRFDEVMVVLRLDSDRSFAAAKMGIQQFVLVPRKEDGCAVSVAIVYGSGNRCHR